MSYQRIHNLKKKKPFNAKHERDIEEEIVYQEEEERGHHGHGLFHVAAFYNNVAALKFFVGKLEHYQNQQLPHDKIDGKSSATQNNENANIITFQTKLKNLHGSVGND